MRARRRAVSAALTAAVVAAASLSGAVSGDDRADAVSTDQSYWIPVGKKIVVDGHGFGHGHGMSQYGAQGAALKGLTYKQIAGFYYPGTSWGTVRGKVRVLVTDDTTDDVVVSAATGLRVRDLGDGSVHELPVRDGLTRWRLGVRDGRTVLFFLQSGTWKRYLASWARPLKGDGEFAASGPISLWLPSGYSRKYRGILRAASPSPGSSARDTVNIVTMDEYVMGVVPAEMPASWHPEAVKAQSVAARTYATWSRNQNLRRYYQICDTTACQVYKGVSAEDSRSNTAVRATARQVLEYGGKPAFTQFSASSGGWTSAGSVPYLKAKQDPYDGWSGNYVHRWTVTVDASVLERKYPSIGTLRRILVTGRDGNGEWQGRVSSMVLEGTRSSATISGDSFRWAYGLRSNWFSIRPTAIIARWNRIGGLDSQLGAVRGSEFAVAAGAAQRFSRGRIFYSRTTGAKELYGPVLKAFTEFGGPSSRLGFPRTPLRKLGMNRLARFQNGSIYRKYPAATVVVSGAIDRRYLQEGGMRSGLGWPTTSNFWVRGGERVDFEHGYIVWTRRTGATRLVRD